MKDYVGENDLGRVVDDRSNETSNPDEEKLLLSFVAAFFFFFATWQPRYAGITINWKKFSEIEWRIKSWQDFVVS